MDLGSFRVTVFSLRSHVEQRKKTRHNITVVHKMCRDWEEQRLFKTVLQKKESSNKIEMSEKVRLRC